MIRVVGLRKSYGAGGDRVVVLEGAELNVDEGAFVAIVGPSGSGKSSLLHVLGGLDTDFEGDVEVCGQRLRGLPDRELARFRGERLGFVFQSFHLVPSMTAVENVQLPAYFARTAFGRARRSALEALERVGLSGKAERLPAQLSGGERQRVAIARALLPSPRLLLCDEPTGNLDAVTGQEVIALFQRLNREGLTVLAVTHEARMSEAARRVVRLSDGRLLEGGSA